ncbi:MAG: class I SAM-dependent methyltransferase [Turneriella sp.]
MDIPKSDFKPWDERYSAEGFFYGNEPNDFLRSQAGRIRPRGGVLCIAEGEGRNAVFLAAQGLSVTAVDGSQVGLTKLKGLAAQKHTSVATLCADLADFDMGTEKWDAIVSIWCHLPQPLRRDVHSQVVTALKPGGVFILEAYTPRQLQFKTGGPPVVELLMTLEALKAELGGLDFLHAVEIDRVIHEGRGHEGQSAVVQIVARRG